MAFFRKAVLASTMIAAGFASTTGAAFAHDDEGDGDKSVVNAQGTDALSNLTACDIDPNVINVLDAEKADVNPTLDLLNKQGDGNDSASAPGADGQCNPETQEGSVDSPGGDTAAADEADARATDN